MAQLEWLFDIRKCRLAKIEPAFQSRLEHFVEGFFCELLHGKNQIVVIVVRACCARGSAPLIAELRPDSLQASGWKSERRGQALCSRLRGHDRLDQSPRRAVGIGRVVNIEGVRCIGGVGPDRGCYFRGCAMGQRAAAGRGNHEPIVGFIGMENAAGAVRA